MPEPKHTPPQTESRRILERVAREADSSGLGLPADQTRTSARGSVPHDDPIEYWGTRIGRTLGLAIGIALTVWLVVFILRGG